MCQCRKVGVRTALDRDKPQAVRPDPCHGMVTVYYLAARRRPISDTLFPDDDLVASCLLSSAADDNIISLFI